MKSAVIFAIICLIFPLSQEKTTLNIEITNIRNNKGVFRISVYTAESQYPYHPAKTYMVKKDSLTNRSVRTSINDLLSGQYGLCILDDENNSGKMESNMLGIPYEGFGFANNVQPFLKHPDYDRVLFRLFPGVNHMQLIIRYRN
jgi:uncharacterized protein (DUF2141 family)